MNEITIIVDYDPFAMESRAYIMNGGNRQESYAVESDIPALAEKLIYMADTHKVYNIKIHGPLAIMYEIKRAIGECEMKTYETNKITVEGL